MEACATQAIPDLTPQRAPGAERPFDLARWIAIASAATLLVGLVWRAVRYFAQFPIWGDEAMLLLNLLDRDYSGLTQHLRYAQVAPLLFLWIERTALLVLGPSEWSLRLAPCLAGFGGLIMFWRACRASLSAPAAGLAVAILAVSYYPIRHGSETKPYAIDLCFAAFCFWMTLHQLRNLDQYRALVALAIITPLAVFMSYPSVFVAGSVSLVLLPMMRQATWTQRGLWGMFNVLLVAAFVTHHGIIGHSQIDAADAECTGEFLRNYWHDAFAPDHLIDWPFWLLKIFTGNMLAHPIGANHGGSTLTFFFVILGSFKLIRDRQGAILAMCWLPFGLNLVAAILKKYPLGDSARITLHLAPFVAVLAAHGLAQALAWVSDPARRARVHLALYALLLACGVVGIVRDLARPFKSEHDRDIRLLARDIAQQAGAGQTVLMAHNAEEGILPEFSWYLRTQSLVLRWQPATPDAAATSCWRIRCTHEVPDPETPFPGWRIDQSESRFVPSENNVMPSIYCQWTRMIRD